VPDFADGFNFDGVADNPSTNSSHDDASIGTRFVPLLFQLPPDIEASRARVKFVYSASDPAGVTAVSDPLTHVTTYTPASGYLRLWRVRQGGETVPGNQEQREGGAFNGGSGDFLANGSSIQASGLNSIGNNVFKVWVEAVRPSAAAGEQQIKIWLDPKGDGNFVGHDEVRASAYTADISAVYSNQFAGNIANSLPDNAGGGATPQSKKKYMLIGALGNNLASIRADVNVSGYSPANLLFVFDDPNERTLKTVGATGVHASNGSSTVTLLSNAVQGTTDATDMYLAWGLDLNGDGSLQKSEVMRWVSNFKVKVVSTATVATARDYLMTQVNLASLDQHPIAANWLYCFLTDQGLEGAVNAASTLTTSDSRYSHHVGAIFNGQIATVNEATFGVSSFVSTQVSVSQDMVHLILTKIIEQATSQADQLAPGTSAAFSYQGQDLAITFEKHDDLRLSIHDASLPNLTITGTLSKSTTGLRSIVFNYSGIVADLYDFDFDAGGKAAQAALVEAGFSGAGTAGHLFKVKIDFAGPPDSEYVFGTPID
jgi:hypothetical protein